MLTLSLRGIRSHLGRFVLTGLAIAMSVGFLSGTFILFPTIEKMLDGMIGQSIQGVDLVVRRQNLGDVGSAGSVDLTEEMGAQLKSVPGVKAVQPMTYDVASLTPNGGDEIRYAEASTWADAPFTVATLASGETPGGPTEVVLDRATAKSKGVSIGDQVSLSITGTKPSQFTVVGLAKFGEADSLAGSTSVFVTSEAIREARTVSAGADSSGVQNNIDWYLIAGSGSQKSLQASVQAVLPTGAEAITGDDFLKEQRSEFSGQVNIFKGIIGGFAAVSLLVGTFLIANTFSIIVAQRAREVALLRALGALRRQVKRMVLLEAVVVGFVCSLLGLGIGVGTAKGLIALLKSATGMPEPPALVLPPLAFITGMLVGVGTTVAAAWLPVRRGTKIEPVAALRNDDVHLTQKKSPVRVVLGSVLIGGAGAVLAAPISGNRFLVGVGASVLFLIGVVLVAPSLVRTFFAGLRPVLGRGAIGELAIDGARRTPRRTASTAAALMIGLALVTGSLTLVNSMKSSLGTSFGRQLGAASVLVGGTDFGDDSVAAIRAIPSVTNMLTVGAGRMVNKDVAKNLSALNPSGAALINLETTSGVGLDQLREGEVLVYEDVAEDGVKVGSLIDVTFRKTGAQKLRVVGVFRNNAGVSNYVISTSTFQKNFRFSTPSRIAIAMTGSPEEGVRAVNAVLKGRGATVQTMAQAIAENNKALDGFLTFIFGLLGVSMVIALLGVVNTMALSVLERTREIGMLRAIGMTRKQVKQVIRREAAAVSFFGVVLGVFVGVPIGIVLVRALSGIGIDRLAIPTTQIAIVSAVALAAGILAALLPARRAGRLDLLHAISHS
jgi:putative ABC transport system permease protein